MSLWYEWLSWNRYANVQVFEEIIMLSREILIKTKDVVQKLGYELIYADTDSVFIKHSNGIAANDQHQKIVNIIRKETGPVQYLLTIHEPLCYLKYFLF
jgi:DNA polymerase elongation subunit (family B)